MGDGEKRTDLQRVAEIDDAAALAADRAVGPSVQKSPVKQPHPPKILGGYPSATAFFSAEAETWPTRGFANFVPGLDCPTGSGQVLQTEHPAQARTPVRPQ